MGQSVEPLGSLLVLVFIGLLMSVLLGIPRGLSARAETWLLALSAAVLFSIGYILHV